MTKDPMSQRVVRVPDDLWERVKMRADERGETVSEVIRERLERYAPAPRAGRHNLFPKFLQTIAGDVAKADVPLVVAVGNLDGEPYVWAYPMTGLLGDDDLNEFIAVAERLPSTEERKVR